MENLLILNSVATYKEAPVPMNVFMTNTSLILDKIRSRNAERSIILVDKEEGATILEVERIVEKHKELALEIIKVEPEYRMLYNNESAVLNLINGVNPLPKSMESNTILFNIEDYVNSDKKQVYVLGNIEKQVKLEINRKTTPKQIIDQCDLVKEFKAMYFGYPMGRLVGIQNLDEVMEISTDYIYIYNEENCMLSELFQLSKDFGEVSCGRCVFGFEGITQINFILADIIKKKGNLEDIKKLDRLVIQMKNQTICDIGSVISTLLCDALNHFGEEIENHITKKVCEAMVCEKFLTYHILASKCIGCTDCLDACKEEAILGKSKFVHVIDQKECTQCGRCIEVCQEKAIVRAGSTKPKCPTKPIPCTKK